MHRRRHTHISSSLWDSFAAADAEQQPQSQSQQPQQSRRNGVCEACLSPIFVAAEDGFPACSNARCAIVYRDVLDCAPEWKTFSANGHGDDKNTGDITRCGNPVNPLLAESSFGCRIMPSTGHRASSYEVKKLQRYTEWQSIPHREKSLYHAFQHINIMAQNAGIPRIFIEDAMRYHKDISAQRMFRGINRDGIKAASIYISCRVNGHPRTAQEIAEIFHLDRASASSGCSASVNLLHNVKRNSTASDTTTAAAAAPSNADTADDVARKRLFSAMTAPAKDVSLLSAIDRLQICLSAPSLFMDRFCSRLQLPQTLSVLCKFIAQKIENEHLLPDDNTPQSIASGIIFYVARMHRLDVPKHQIRAVCNVSEVTINKVAKKIEAIKHKVVPNCT